MNANDILRTQMMMSLGMVRNPLLNLLALNVFDIAAKSFPVWSAWTKSTCCSRKRANQIPSSIVKTPKASITCERGVSQQAANGRQTQPQTVYQTRMDAVIHYVTTRPEMKSLLAVTHHDYLPNEFEPIELETDTFFELLDMQVVDGAPSILSLIHI